MLDKSACTNCSVGTFSPVFNANSSATCRVCPAGTSCASSGLAEGTPCPAGYSTNNLPGSSACSPCANRYFAALPGQAACALCPPGTFTPAVGSASCVSLYSTCPTGAQPNAPGISSSLNPDTDCTPLVCAPLWEPNAPNPTACLGCAPGTYGAKGNCRACLPGSQCPGFLPAPLPPSALKLALAIAPGSSASCTAASLIAPSAANSLLPASLPSIVLIIIGGTIGAVSVALLLIYCAAKRCGLRNIEGIFRFFDFFGTPTVSLAAGKKGTGASAPASALPVAPSATSSRTSAGDATQTGSSVGATAHGATTGGEVQPRRTALGGFFAKLFAITFCGLLAWQLLSFFWGNAVLSVTPDLLKNGVSDFSSLPWAAPRGPSRDALLPPLPPRVSIQLRLLGQSDLGCARPVTPFVAISAPVAAEAAAAPIGITAAAGEGGMWRLDSSSSCSGSGTSLLLLSCLDCALSTASFVSFALNFTCQVLFLEAIAVDSNGDLNTITFPADQLLAGARNSTTGGFGFLASVTWTTTVIFSVVQDGVNSGADSLSARGYRLLSSSALTTLFSPSLDNAGGGVLPLANQVVVRVNLPLQSLYFSTAISNRVTVSQLVTSIVSLFAISGVFALLFRVFKSLRKTKWAQNVLGSSKTDSGTLPAPESAASLRNGSSTAGDGSGGAAGDNRPSVPSQESGGHLDRHPHDSHDGPAPNLHRDGDHDEGVAVQDVSGSGAAAGVSKKSERISPRKSELAASEGGATASALVHALTALGSAWASAERAAAHSRKEHRPSFAAPQPLPDLERNPRAAQPRKATVAAPSPFLSPHGQANAVFTGALVGRMLDSLLPAAGAAGAQPSARVQRSARVQMHGSQSDPWADEHDWVSAQNPMRSPPW
jgi:hypothetical protein